MTSMLPLWKDFSYFPHQVEGIHWMLSKEIEGTIINDTTKEHTVYGGIQCDDMGLGKTIQVTSTIINHPLPKTLIVAPIAMIDTWSEVCIRAGIHVFQYEQKTWVQKGNFFQKRTPATCSVYITNYERVTTKVGREWDRIVLDEAHKIRNGSSFIACNIRELLSPICWAVTGTPIVNGLRDIVSLMAFIGVQTSPTYKWEERYFDILPELLIHRSLNSLRDVIQGAPPVPVIHDIVLPFINEKEEQFYADVQRTDPDLEDSMSSTNPLQMLLRLRQLSVHPQLYINSKRRESTTYKHKDWKNLTTKFQEINEIINDELDDEEPHKYIIFCQFMEEMTMLQEELSYITPHVYLYNGAMSQNERSAVLETSKAVDGISILLIQLQAGGVGLNLQEYDRMIFISPWWTSALINQAVARSVRMGQKKIVTVYHLHLCNEKNVDENELSHQINIDDVMQTKANEKRDLLDIIFTYCKSRQLLKQYTDDL